MVKKITIYGRNINDITSFYAEVNRVFMQTENWEIGESLDAFNDLLYGGFGAISGNEPVELIWTDAAISADSLGYLTTKAYYKNKLHPGSPFNKEHFNDKLKELESGNSQTYFDILVEIISGRSNITLILC
jgi:RNAse (barnase) inhibitor barstar